VGAVKPDESGLKPNEYYVAFFETLHAEFMKRPKAWLAAQLADELTRRQIKEGAEEHYMAALAGLHEDLLKTAQFALDELRQSNKALAAKRQGPRKAAVERHAAMNRVKEKVLGKWANEIKQPASRRRGVGKFASAMQGEYPRIKNPVTVKRWIAEGKAKEKIHAMWLERRDELGKDDALILDFSCEALRKFKAVKLTAVLGWCREWKDEHSARIVI
jgi:hypothetical protein